MWYSSPLEDVSFQMGHLKHVLLILAWLCNLYLNRVEELRMFSCSNALFAVTQTMVMNKLGWNKPHKQLNAQMSHRVKCKTHRFFLKSKHICLFDVDQWIRMLCLGTCSISVHRGICNVISLQIVTMKLAYGLKTWLGRVSYWGASTTWNQKHQMSNIAYLNKASERCCVSLFHSQTRATFFLFFTHASLDLKCSVSKGCIKRS